jgi:preprotein translocase subunit YajC
MVLTISVFVFIQTSNTNSNLVQYLSFAGSITSLVLGLIAIFYSIISNQQSTENFGKLKEAVTKIEEGARIISGVSSNINSKLDKISDDIVKIGTKDKGDQVVSTTTFTADKNVEITEESNLPDEETSKSDN